MQRGLACCPICGDYARVAIEEGVLVLYHACSHFRGAWSAEQTIATFAKS